MSVIDIREPGSTKKYVLFGLPRIGSSVMMGLADFALFLLYAVGYGVPDFLVLLALGIGKFCIAASQSMMGWISDAKYTRWGRRKPYLVILSPILGISFFLMMLPTLVVPISNGEGLFFWLLVFNIVFQISYGISTPYDSWMAEQFKAKDRATASQYKNIFAYIGTGLMFVFTMVVLVNVDDNIQAYPNVIPPELFISVVLFSLLGPILFILVAILMPTEPEFKIESNMIENVKNILRNKNFLLVTGMQGIASMGIVLIGDYAFVFIDEVLAFDQTEFIVAAVGLVGGIFVFLTIWKKLMHKIGKKKCILYIFLSAACFLPFSLIALIPMDSYLVFGIIFMLGLAATLGGWAIIPAVMYADLAEDDEKRTGELKAGIYQGFPSITLNIFQAFGLLLGSLMAISFGEDLSRVFWGPVVAIILVGAYFYSKKFIQLDFDWEETNIVSEKSEIER